MPTVRSILARAFAPLRRAAEGSVRGGPYYLPRSDAWLPAGSPINWWQVGISPLDGDRSAIVERCISLYSQTIASLPPTHWRRLYNGGRVRVTNSALARILKRPNDYQNISDFMMNLVRNLYAHGNAYVLALRNERWEITSLHLMDSRLSSPPVVRSNADEDLAGQVFNGSVEF